MGYGIPDLTRQRTIIGKCWERYDLVTDSNSLGIKNIEKSNIFMSLRKFWFPQKSQNSNACFYSFCPPFLLLPLMQPSPSLLLVLVPKQIKLLSQSPMHHFLIFILSQILLLYSTPIITDSRKLNTPRPNPNNKC